MPAPAQETRTEPTFGQVAVRNHFATAEQVNECIQIQNAERTKGENPRFLGQIMVEKGYLSAEKVQEVMRVRAQLLALPAFQIPGYEILAKLGQGGMGAVFKARQVSMDRLVALKLLPQRLQQNKSYIERFYQEARSAGKLNHENIVRAFDVGEANGIHFFSMEFVDGESVQAMLRREKQLAEKQALEITLQIAKALDHAYKHNLVHRDVKPENIMITKEGVAKLCDLGLAKDTTGDSSLTQAGTCVGTPHYIAPEQARGEPDIDIRADLYSLGASLYHMLIGEPVFNGPSPAVVMTKHITEAVPDPRTLRDDVSEGACAVILKAMEKERDQRYQAPGEMIADIEKVIAGGPITSYEPTRVGTPVPRAGSTRRMRDTKHMRMDSPALARSQKPRHSNAGMIIGISAVVAIAIVGAILATRKKVDPTPPTPPPKEAAVIPPVTPPPTTPAPTQAQEDKAKSKLDVVEKIRAEKGNDPKGVAEVIKLYNELIEDEDVRFTKWALKAREDLAAFRAEVEQMATVCIEMIRKEAADLSAKEQFAQAAKAYDKFPPELATTQAWAKAKGEADELRKKANAKLDSDLRKADDLAASFKFDDAKTLLEGLKPSCDEAQIKKVDEKLGQVAEAQKKYVSAMQEKASAAYDEMRKLMNAELRERKFADARGRIEKARKDPVLATREATLKLDADELGLFEALFADALNGAKALARAKRPITLTTGQALIDVQDDKILIHPKEGGTMAREIVSLKPSEVESLVKEVLPPAAPESLFKLALLWFYDCDLDKPASIKSDERKRAHDALEAAMKAEPRAERYCRWFDEAVNAAQVQTARELYEKAKESIAAQKWSEALKQLNALLNTCGDTSFVRDRKDEIDGLIKEAQDKLKGVPAGIEKLFAGKVKGFSERDLRIDILYDWSNVDQRKDWDTWAWVFPGQQVGPADWHIDKGELLGAGHQSLYWKAKMRGPVEVSFALTPRVDHNLGVEFCDGHNGKGYRAALGYELPDHEFPDQRVAQALQPKPISLLKLDLAEALQLNWQRDPAGGLRKLQQDVHKTLAGRDDVEFNSGKSYFVSVRHNLDGNLVFILDKQTVAQVTDATYSAGQVALWCDVDPGSAGEPCGGWKDVHIVGYLDPDWYRSAPK